MKKFLVLWLLVVAGCQRAGADFQVVDLQVNYEATPMTVETKQPQFSWRMESDSGRGRQSAYELEVNSETGKLLWTSGRVGNSQSVGVRYAGDPLVPASRYQWKVKVWDGNGDLSEGMSWFETGFMRQDENSWSGARWIGGGERDLVFQADYLSVFKINFDVQIDSASGGGKAAFLLGGNDFRLLNRDLNTFQVENSKDESFIALELNISGVAEESGKAHLNVYRVGYTGQDSKSKPLASLPISKDIINSTNLYETHRIYLQSVFGLFNIYIGKETEVNRITAYNPRDPSTVSHGLTVNPVGAGGDFVAYPMLGDMGFWMRPGQKARFSNIEIRHYRSPSNILFAAGSVDSQGYREIFLDESGAVRALDNGAYEVSPGDRELVYLADPSRDGAPMLRREFALDNKPISKARLYATARGIYEVYVNGERVGNDYFTPGLTQYNKHHTYQAYDVTGQLKGGERNAIGAWLSEGWWSGNSTYTGDHWNFFGDRQSLLAKLVVTYEDGTVTEVVTEPGTWQVFHGGPVRYGSFFQGEIYDAGREEIVAGWASADYDDSQWQPARAVPLESSVFMGDRDSNKPSGTTYQDMQLIGHPGNSPQVVETLQAASVDEVRPGVFVYDMGQNMVGVPRIHLPDGISGKPVILRYAEMLYPEHPDYEELSGMLMVENLRAALVHDIYYPKGGGEVIQPRFTFHGYRYIEISGIDKALPLEAVEGLVVSSVAELTADYESSNPLVNKLWENITWSLRGNFLSIPTDTPARNERLGWSGDLNVFARTAGYMAHVNPFIKRHMMAMRDLQNREGRFPDVAPLGGGFGGALWGTAGIIVPWEIYQQYGDITLLQEQYPAMVRYIEFLQGKIDPQTSLLQEGPLGDWLSPEDLKNDRTLLWEAYRVHSLDILARVAGLLGETEDAKKFRRLYEERKGFFNKTYVDAETGRTISSGMVADSIWRAPRFDVAQRGKLVDTQASYAIPIAMGVFDEANMDRAGQHLAETVIRKNVDDGGVTRPGYSLMTGFIGTASLPEALSKSGRDDLVYQVLQQTSYPSWLYSVVNGATTIWERLNSYTAENGFGGNNRMNSFNHYAFGAVGSWMMSHSLGIRRADKSPGFQQFVLAPTPDPTGQMSWAKGYYDSLYGRIESRWSIDGQDISYQFVVPENTTTTLYLPASADSSVATEGDAAFVTQNESRRVYKLEPGIHRFTVGPSG